MSEIGRRTTTHQTRIDAPAPTVYRIIADAAAWPQRFGPTVHVERTDLGAGAERLRLWATAGDRVLSWTSLRELDKHGLTVTFRQEVTNPPVAAMGGTWKITPVTADSCVLTLLHDFEAVDDDPTELAWIAASTDRNSTIELSNIKALAESWDEQQSLVFSFADDVVIDGGLQEAYEFLYQAGLWSGRLPHVAAIDLREEPGNVQWMKMVTRAMDGSEHTTESVRVGFGDRIVYKQLVPPALMTAHTGVWSLEQTDSGVHVTSSHTVAVNPAAITAVLGEQADLEAACKFIRAAVGGNSAATLKLTRQFVELVHV